MTTTNRDVSEKQARQVAEAARETEWRKPSFGKELFLGRFRLDLIDDTPPPAGTRPEFFAALEAFLRTEVDGPRIEREARIPDEVFHGLARLGAFAMKIDQEYGGSGRTNLEYCRALAPLGSINTTL